MREEWTGFNMALGQKKSTLEISSRKTTHHMMVMRVS